MEIRVLRYFLEIAREGSMTNAAEYLHVTQPTLSKQMKELESELGKKLFKRGSRSLRLTDEGMLLRKRAEEILDIVDKTTDEFKALDIITGGEIKFGSAESYQIRYLAQIIREFREEYPLFHFNVISGNTEQVTELLDRGSVDFALLVESPNISKYNYIKIPHADEWGLLMRRDSPLASKNKIQVEDIIGIPLFASKQAAQADFPRWCGERVDELNLIGSFNLTYNASIFVKEGLGYLLTFKDLANTSVQNELCFVPLFPRLETDMYIIWKRYQVFTPIAELFLEKLQTSPILHPDMGEKNIF